MIRQVHNTHTHTHNITYIDRLVLTRIQIGRAKKALHAARGALRAQRENRNRLHLKKKYSYLLCFWTWTSCQALSSSPLLQLWRNELTATQSRDQLRRPKRQQQHLRSSTNSSSAACPALPARPAACLPACYSCRSTATQRRGWRVWKLVEAPAGSRPAMIFLKWLK